jgi:hypothetical protein
MNTTALAKLSSLANQEDMARSIKMSSGEEMFARPPGPVWRSSVIIWRIQLYNIFMENINNLTIQASHFIFSVRYT